MNIQARWTKIADALTLEQYKKTMGIRNYKAKALLVRDHVSKSKKIKALCDDLIKAYDLEFSAENQIKKDIIKLSEYAEFYYNEFQRLVIDTRSDDLELESTRVEYYKTLDQLKAYGIGGVKINGIFRNLDA